MFFLSMLLLAMMPTVCAESQRYGSHKKAVAVKQVQNIKQDTELIQAVKSGNSKAVRKLLKKKTLDINELDRDNKTALDLAVQYQHKKIVLLLAQAGGKVTCMDHAEFVNKVVIRSGSNIFKGIFFSLLCVTFGVGFIVAVGLGAMAMVMAGAMSTCNGSMAGFSAAITIVGFVGLPLAYFGIRTIVRGFDSLRDIKSNHLAEFYII